MPVRRILITFPEPVELDDKVQQQLVETASVLCANYERTASGRIMWPAGIGQLPTFIPLTVEQERARGIEFDPDTFAIECCEREAHPEELRKRQRKIDRETREAEQLSRMDATPRLGTYYAGHDRCIVLTQDDGKFSERQMTVAEKLARGPAARIHHRIWEMATYAAFAYYRAWELIVPAIEEALAHQAAEHDRRVTELLEANNREVEARRVAERAAEAGDRCRHRVQEELLTRVFGEGDDDPSGILCDHCHNEKPWPFNEFPQHKEDCPLYLPLPTANWLLKRLLAKERSL